MALAIRIEFYTDNALVPEFIIEPHWWKASELLAAYLFTQQYMNGYLNDHLQVTIQQLAKMHSCQVSNAKNLGNLDHIAFNQIEETIKSDTQFKKIQINIYEWDTAE